MSISLNSGVTLFPLVCIPPLTQILHMPLLCGILIVTGRLQSPHLLTFFFFFFSHYKISIVSRYYMESKSWSVAFIVATLQCHIIVYFLFWILNFFLFTNWHLLSIYLNSGVTLFPTLLCVSPLAQTLQMPLLYGILIVAGKLQPLHLFFFFFNNKFSIDFNYYMEFDSHW